MRFGARKALAALGCVLGCWLPLAAHAADSDGDGVDDTQDCAPADPTVATLHRYYFDLDGDQAGNPAQSYELCSTKPFDGSVTSADDPDDTKASVRPQPVARGTREIGIDVTAHALGASFDAARVRALGAQTAPLAWRWSELEGAGGVAVADSEAGLVSVAAKLNAAGLGLHLAIHPVDGNQLTLPPDLQSALFAGTLRVSDTAFIERYRKLLTRLKASLGATPVRSIELGRDIDRFMAVLPADWFWADYAIFIRDIRTHARTLWGNDVQVGFSATRDGAVSATYLPKLRVLAAQADYVGIDWIALDAQWKAIAPSQVAASVTALTTAWPSNKLRIVQLLYPSAPAAGSSTTQQSQFLQALFLAWDKAPAAIASVALPTWTDAARNGTDAGSRLVASFGLHSLPADTAATPPPKAAFHTLLDLLRERAWLAPKAASRGYLLGVTPYPYDQTPDQLPTDAVMDAVFADAAQWSDMVMFHFDKGVPWVEAHADGFTQYDAPYGQHLKTTWQQHGSRLSPGQTLAISINPLGVPRDRIAAYWGYGEGYSLNAKFERVGTGSFKDADDRLPPAPWGTYRLNSPQVKQAFLNYVLRNLQHFNPEFLLIGLEVNLAVDVDAARFADYVELHRYVYETIKSYPAWAHVKLGVSFTAEDLVADEFGTPYVIDNIKDKARMQKHRNALTALAPYSDFVGLAVYPIKTRFGADKLPASMLHRVFETVRSLTTKPIAVTETGYPAAGFTVAGRRYDGTPAAQAQFYRLLTEAADADGHVLFINQFATRDLTPYLDKLRALPGGEGNAALVAFFQYFEHNGILTAGGQARDGSTAWAESLSQSVTSGAQWVAPLKIASPLDGRLQVQLYVGDAGQLVYTVLRDGSTVVDPSPLGLTVDGVDLGQGIVALEPGTAKTKDELRRMLGGHALARNRNLDQLVIVRRSGKGDHAYAIEFHVEAGGVAFRYVVPGSGARTIAGEASGWRLPYNTLVWHQPYVGNYESMQRMGVAGGFGDRIALPFTAELADGRFVTVAESGVGRSTPAWSGLALQATLGSPLLAASFPGDTQWTAAGGQATPWRVTIVADTLDELVNNDLVGNLAEAPDAALFPNGADTSWIKPGRAVWSWWSDSNSGFLFDAQKQYVDYAAQLGFEYSVVDAWWEQGFPAAGKNQFQRLAELVQYASSDGRKVGIWVWKSWVELLDPAARLSFLTQVKNAGAVGVKIDNLYGDGGDSALFLSQQEAVLRDAAKLGLMMNFHGMSKPAGLSVTWPNEITREAMVGLEINGLAWNQGYAVPAFHNAVLPFTRFVAGVGDYTPLTFDERKLGTTSFTHQLALFGLYTSPLQHLAEHPSRVLAQTTVLDVLKAIPTVWDETRVLAPSRIGALALMARRSGERWFVFGISGREDAATTAAIDLGFLGAGHYDAVLVRDAGKTQFKRETLSDATAATALSAAIPAGGGFVALFTPRETTANNTGKRGFRMGMTSVPPVNSTAGYQSVYGALASAADLVVQSFQDGVPWAQALASSDPKTYPASLQARWKLHKDAMDAATPNHARYLMLNPIATTYDGLALTWATYNNEPLAAPWNGYAFNHPNVKQAVLNWMIATVDYFKPTYLAIGVESNILLAKKPWMWAGYKELNAYLYTELKKRYPKLWVFPTIHYEHMLGEHEESRALAAQYASSWPTILVDEVADLMKSSDLLALSTYPYMVFGSPLRGDDYAAAIALSKRTGKRMAIDQTGYPSKDFYFSPLLTTLPGSTRLQDEHLGHVLRFAAQENLEFVVNFVAIDYGLNFGDDPTTLTWSTTGLIDDAGQIKPALNTWWNYLKRPYVSPGAAP